METPNDEVSTDTAGDGWDMGAYSGSEGVLYSLLLLDIPLSIVPFLTPIFHRD